MPARQTHLQVRTPATSAWECWTGVHTGINQIYVFECWGGAEQRNAQAITKDAGCGDAAPEESGKLHWGRQLLTWKS